MHTTTRRNFLALSGISLLAAAGCGTAAGSAGGARNTTTVRYQGSSGAVSPLELAAALGHLGDLKLDWVGDTISGPQDIQSVASGQTDIGGAFNGAVVKLAARKAPITSVVSYYGADQHAFNGFYVSEKSTIRGARDLVGKKVGMNTLGAHHEAMLDIYLKKNGLSPSEAEQVERIVVPPVNTEQALRQGQIEVAVLGGILRDKALETGGIRKLFSDYDLRGSFSAGTYVLTDRFIEQNPETVRTLVTGVGKALDWSRATSREEVVARLSEIIAKRKRNESAEAIKYFRSYGVAAPGGRIEAEELSVWSDWLTDRGEIKGGQVDIPDLYTNEFNKTPATKGS
ncbi:ABC transporter substrate-binding protein [Streptomyces mesophilus]|uniref:ABC transporter substrate-binding protein n=1 Tax=Streptomyces mesophilus TaxID=1775132 RepID=UPI002E2E4B3F|nr:ABC transporter substrate-binding protein [Streptomyces mesophilus]